MQVATFMFFDFNSNGLRVQLYNNTIAFATGSSLIQVTVNGADTNSWHHIACVRSSSTAILYYNGINVGTFSSTENITMGSTASIGRYGGSGNYYSGYLQDFRVYKGVAKYTSNFIPASTNPDILPDTPSGVSGGSKLAKVTDGAVAFDGSGDYLSTASSSSDFSFGTGDFTIEMFLYSQEAGGKGFIQFSDTAGGLKATSTGVITIHKDATGVNGVFRAYAKNTSTAFSTPVPYRTWCHVAMTRESGTIKLYVNGKQDATTITGDTTNYATTYVAIGGYYDTGYLSNCSISNVRINKGTVVYTSDFTPPTSPLTNVTNTKLLCCQSNTSAIAAAVIPTGIITANGDAAATNFNPFNTDINTVLGQETGYPTWNPLVKSTSTLSNGNLTITTNGGSGYPIELVNTFTPKGRGQWYWEFVLSALSGSNYTLLGMIPSDSPYVQGNSNNFTEAATRGFSVYVGHNGSVSAYSGAATAGSATATIGVGGVVGWAYDAENGTLKCSINGAPQGTQFTNIRTDVGWLFGVTDYDNSATASYTINFGQKPFKFPPPAGFQPLNAANVRPETVIARPDHYVAATIYTGNGTGQSINTGQKPDFVWIKNRTDATSHMLFDSVRGVQKVIYSNANTQELPAAISVTAFNRDGFTISSANEINGNNDNIVAWTWKAGGNKGTWNKDDVGICKCCCSRIRLEEATAILMVHQLAQNKGSVLLNMTGHMEHSEHVSGPRFGHKLQILSIVKKLEPECIASGWFGILHLIQLATPIIAYLNTTGDKGVFSACRRSIGIIQLQPVQQF